MKQKSFKLKPKRTAGKSQSKTTAKKKAISGRLLSKNKHQNGKKKRKTIKKVLALKKPLHILYHGISQDGIYRLGAALADFSDPAKITARTDRPIFEPRFSFEKTGQTPNVIFPCGNVVIGKNLFMYYGGADRVTGVATIPLAKLLDILEIYQS